MATTAATRPASRAITEEAEEARGLGSGCNSHGSRDLRVSAQGGVGAAYGHRSNATTESVKALVPVAVAETAATVIVVGLAVMIESKNDLLNMVLVVVATAERSIFVVTSQALACRT
ncbi:hypothetical protein PRNP1_003615 [Phytophthora ramorum]